MVSDCKALVGIKLPMARDVLLVKLDIAFLALEGEDAMFDGQKSAA